MLSGFCAWNWRRRRVSPSKQYTCGHWYLYAYLLRLFSQVVSLGAAPHQSSLALNNRGEGRGEGAYDIERGEQEEEQEEKYE